MPVGQQQQGPIACPIAAHLAGSLQQLLDRRERQVLSGSTLGIWAPTRGREERIVPAGTSGAATPMPRRSRTFPFRGIGAGVTGAGFLGDLATEGECTFPRRVFLGKF